MLDPDNSETEFTLKAIVKRRKRFGDQAAQSEDRENNTTVHFKPKDADEVGLGYYCKIDDEWHSIIDIKDGRNFDSGKTKFFYVSLDNDVMIFKDEPVWT